MVSIHVNGLGKKYGANRLFKGIDLELKQGTYAVTGINGSGKSTFLLCLSGFITPNEGKVEWKTDGKNIAIENLYTYFTFCSPALTLFEELSLREVLNYHAGFQKSFVLSKAMDDLERFGLQKAIDKQVHKFSSGMKQRLKLLMSFHCDVPVLFLDEPCTNLDEDGIALYQSFLKRENGKKLIVVATNQLTTEFLEDGTIIRLDNYKNNA